MNTKFLSKLKKAGERRETVVEFDDAKFTLREMTGTMRDFWDGDSKKRVKFKGMNPDLNTLQTEGQRALLVAMTLVDDETNELAFDHKSEDDLNTLGELSGVLLDKLMDEALEVCGMSDKSTEEAEKN